jgi:microcystin-dependent protein
MSNFNVKGFGECNATNFPNNNCLITKLFANNYVDSSLNIIGEVRMFTGTEIPTGWLFCGGQSLDASANPQYSALFNVIGTTYGGTGKTNFNIPNLSQKMPIGSTNVDQRYVNYQDASGVYGGAKNISFNQMTSHAHSFESHTHSYSYYNIIQTINNSNNTYTFPSVNTTYLQSLSHGNVAASGNTDNPNTSSGNAGNGADYLPPFTTVSFIIFYGYY